MNDKILIISGCSWIDGWDVNHPLVQNEVRTNIGIQKCISTRHSYSVQDLFQVNYPDVIVVDAGHSGMSNYTSYLNVINRLNSFGINYNKLKSSDVIHYHALTSLDRLDNSVFNNNGIFSDSIRVKEVIEDPESSEYDLSLVGCMYENNNVSLSAKAISIMYEFSKSFNGEFYTGISFDDRCNDVFSCSELASLPPENNIHNSKPYRSFLDLLIKKSTRDNTKLYEQIQDPMQNQMYNHLLTRYMYHDGHPNISGVYVIYREVEQFLISKNPEFFGVKV